MSTFGPRLAVFSLFAMVGCSSSEPDAAKTKDAKPEPTAAAVPAPQPEAAPTKPPSIRGIPRPLSTDTAGLVMVDRVDIANDPDEAAHAYAIVGQTYRGMHDFEWVPGKASYLEDGRSTKGSESFRLECLPNQD